MGTQHTVEPMAGRLVVFTSGRENLHQVKKVTSGTRYVMSMWFTCNKAKEISKLFYGHSKKKVHAQKSVHAQKKVSLLRYAFDKIKGWVFGSGAGAQEL